jgi:flagellar L-ring protein precursor FlgH
MNKPYSWFSKLLLAVVVATSSQARADSLWKASDSKSMYADKKAGEVGDILTITVQETSSGTKDRSTQTAKKSSIDASIAAFLYSPTASTFLTHKGQLPAISTSQNNSYQGGGTVSADEKIIAMIPVRVVDVLPNHNLVIEGTRETEFGGETQKAILRGVVRVEDIAPNDTVYSYNVADATIKFVGTGPLSDSEKRGWFTKIWDKFTPF